MSETLKSPKIGVAGILRRSDGRVLVAKRGRPPAAGEWAFPGGKVQWRESLEDALIREFREETGLWVEVGPLLCFTEIIGEAHYVVLDFAVSAIGGSLTARSDAAELAWMNRDELRQHPLAPGMERCLVDNPVQTYLGWAL